MQIGTNSSKIHKIYVYHITTDDLAVDRSINIIYTFSYNSSETYQKTRIQHRL